MKIKKGDNVQILTGKDRGRQGKVERVFVKELTLLIPGLNQYKKHRKPQGEGKPGEILTLDKPIAVSKVALVCTKCKQLTRVGYRFVDDKKIRVCRKCDADI
ncbi:50S ribosomal protein L24 [Candidatus Amesbacteria bacterium RIFOXYB1_FULL_44_23]|uniref:Large ribosomal subunit protein uL24 n=1 Tax=Candidatus Amesbacteria bacterium RIFOXYB1_FULL_44_23 TaxID=1797263 RepID=A0A1F4ZV55_9BACT|nr:MAG: 50S ribosomal protein L24 [Candidatus Amesbacteria bacterium RIFOXYB1_FULL_44_23]